MVPMTMIMAQQARRICSTTGDITLPFALWAFDQALRYAPRHPVAVFAVSAENIAWRCSTNHAYGTLSLIPRRRRDGAKPQRGVWWLRRSYRIRWRHKSTMYLLASYRVFLRVIIVGVHSATPSSRFPSISTDEQSSQAFMTVYVVQGRCGLIFTATTHGGGCAHLQTEYISFEQATALCYHAEHDCNHDTIKIFKANGARAWMKSQSKPAFGFMISCLPSRSLAI